MIHEATPFKLCPCGVVHREAFQPADLAAWRRQFRNMFWADAAKGSMLDAMDEGATGGAAFGSLHTAYSATGTNEVTGGSPAYARVALTWAAASGSPRTKALAATLPTWNVPAATTVGWFGLWTLVTGGTFLGMQPLGGAALLNAMVEVAADITNNDIFSKGHGLVLDNRVVFWGTLPTGLTVGTIYWVISTGLTTDSFRVSTTQGGSAVDLTGTQPFGFFAQKCVPQTTVTQDTISLSSGSIDLNVVA
jgi:hypothetical protein